MEACTRRTGALLRSHVHQPTRSLTVTTRKHPRLLIAASGTASPSWTQCSQFHGVRRVPDWKGIGSRAYIALGSNLGDRFAMIEQACNQMEAGGKIQITRTSSLFVSKPMYVLDQDDFLNGVCEVSSQREPAIVHSRLQIQTTLPPLQLLDELQAIENSMGRVKVIDKGPRNIDLDILLYDRERLTHPRLQVPHPLMLERKFVLRPLVQYVHCATIRL